jgi:hypothetical protein
LECPNGSAAAELFAVAIDSAALYRAAGKPQEAGMITLAIRYTLEANKLADFEAYVRELPAQVERAGGRFVGYYLPTKLAGPTNAALGLIDFPDLASYERYRQNLAGDTEAAANVRRAEAAGCILNEDRAFMRRCP